jgi:hypothetical protein
MTPEQLQAAQDAAVAAALGPGADLAATITSTGNQITVG